MMKQATPKTIQEAATMLQEGEIVAFPTETVYGLGADARHEEAVERIFAAKGRPGFNPLIVHVPDLDAARELAVFDARAETVAASLWPGPITLVLPARPGNGIAAAATAGLKSIALRIPAHPVAMDLLRAVGRPIAAPSANASGFLSPTRADHVVQSLGENVKLVLAGGASTVGIESTVLDLTTHHSVILRSGAIGAEELESLVGTVAYSDGTDGVKSPGQLMRHYATKTPLRMNAVDVRPNEALLAFGKTQFIGVAGVGFVSDMDPNYLRNLSPEGDLYQAATNLYAALHELDESGALSIAVMRIPEQGLGIAINDRLRRAAIRE